MARPQSARSFSTGHRPVRGFSLIELIVSIVILGILAAATVPIFSSTLRGYVDSSAHLTTLSKARFTTERIARELREIRALPGGGYDFLAPLGATSMTFRKQDGTVVALAAAGANVNMTYAPPGVTATLTDEMTALSFIYRTTLGVPGATAANVAVIEVSVTLSNRGGTHTQRTRVALRGQP